MSTKNTDQDLDEYLASIVRKPAPDNEILKFRHQYRSMIATLASEQRKEKDRPLFQKQK